MMLAMVLGGNTSGQLGDGTTINRSFSPTQVPGSSWSSVATGDRSHTCAIRSDGSLWCWGFNAAGQLGDGTTTNRSSPTPVPGTMWVQVSPAVDHTCATRSDGSLWCWGSNAMGKLGDGTTERRSTPTQVPGNSWSSVATGRRRSCATRSDESLWCWGSNDGRIDARVDTTS